ncbi:MAG: AAA family ATPase [Planctomycetota bacterium]|nr:AAA family ATPase [Planctomycetota bacterium]
MIEGFWIYVQGLLQNNQIFSGGLLLMVGGAVLAYFRQLPSQLYHFIRRQFITEIDILDRDQAFEWLEKWLAQHSYSKKRARSLTVKTEAIDYEERRDNPMLDARPRILFSPAPGVHWLFFRRRLVCLHRERPKLKEATTQVANVRECFNVTIFSRDRKLAHQLLEEAREVALPKTDVRLTVHRASHNYWNEQMKRLPRPVESVVLAEGVMEDLIADAKTFLGRREWYCERGIPYRRGYLLNGPPGTGKSSAVVAIASALGMDIAMLSLGDSNMEDSGISELFSSIPVNSIVLMEDIDCAFIDRKEADDKRSKVTFSGLLNAIDGVAAGEGRLLFATTNHIERLDPALIRPGRIDRKMFIGYATQEQAARLFQRFFPTADGSWAREFADRVPLDCVTMSTLQTHLLMYSEDPQLAVDKLVDLLCSQPLVGRVWNENSKGSNWVSSSLIHHKLA